jgi:hypothetical protein
VRLLRCLRIGWQERRAIFLDEPAHLGHDLLHLPHHRIGRRGKAPQGKARPRQGNALARLHGLAGAHLHQEVEG